MGFWKRLLDTLIDPNLISLMLSLGVLGIVVELWHPGLIFPATFGVLCLSIAFFGLDVLPISWAGLVLIAAAFAFWIAELFVAFSHGALTLAGAACFVFGCAPALRAGRLRLPGLAAARARDRRRDRALLRVRAREGRRRSGGGRPRSAPQHDRRRARARSGATASSPSAASCGRHAPPRASRSQPASEVEVVGIEGLELVVRPAGPAAARIAP